MNNILSLKFAFTCSLSFLCLCCRSQDGWQHVTIDGGYNYSVPNFGQLKRTLSERANTITAEITVNNDSLSKIQFAKAE
ncbi:hypothetical protein [Chryseolinea lacunae]|uniref:Uncharacterized protein n=1 Tax=Chryseolinea lacunae TaxID=2801331 RepID=A0ABS1L072_9BACT|nr:hypothetical protein [Chryseolinea lacunae]MBL0745090.1 hypothetical protein [Chryseolinea lacunae]